MRPKKPGKNRANWGCACASGVY